MSLPSVVHHLADLSNVDNTTEHTFTLPADLETGDGIICVIGSWDNRSGFNLEEDDAEWIRLDTAEDYGLGAEALVLGRVSDGTESATTVSVSLFGMVDDSATAIVNIFVVRNWFGDFTDGFATVAHTYLASTGSGPKEYTPPPITVGWPSSDQHLVMVWAVAGRNGGAFVATPAGYTAITDSINSVDTSNRGISVATGFKELTGLTDTPGDFDNDSNFMYRYAGTFAIRGASTAPAATLDDSAFEPGEAITGTYANYDGAPTVVTLTDSEDNTISSASEITDLVIDDAAKTYAFTMPDRITTGTGTTLLRGDITLELD